MGWKYALVVVDKPGPQDNGPLLRTPIFYLLLYDVLCRDVGADDA